MSHNNIDVTTYELKGINISNERLNDIRRSLEDTIRQTNRVSYSWIQQMSKSEKPRYIITMDNVKSVFNGYLGKMLRHHIRNDVEVKRFISWNKPHISIDVDSLQIVNLEFLPMRDFDHPFLQYAKQALPTINYKDLEASKVTITTPTEIENITFDSIINIKF
jgi:hypothetical protein